MSVGLTAANFAPGVQVTLLPDSLGEVSGLAHSRLNPDIFWMHNDSGDQARVYAVSRAGRLVGTFVLGGARAVDWEAMAIGPAPNKGSYLYLADIGDNSGRRSDVQVYRVAEPAVSANQAAVRLTLPGVVTYHFTYEDGARDAEAFMVDPLTGDFYVVSKRELDGNRLYRASAPSDSGMNTFRRVGTFGFTGTTAADISSDGLQVAIRRYSNSTVSPLTPPGLAASYWSRPNASISLVALLAQPGQVIPLVIEAQGEAIAFDTSGRGFYTTTEHGTIPNAIVARAPITFYQKQND